MSSEQPKSWHDKILELEEILNKEEFVTVPDHLTFEEFDEWLMQSFNKG